jgi:hypothetical protein
MKGGKQDNCPLCDNPQTQAVELAELASRRIECSHCTTDEISDGLERILANNPEAKRRARYLSDAARRATGKGERLILTEESYLGIAAEEESAQYSEAAARAGWRK